MEDEIIEPGYEAEVEPEEAAPEAVAASSFDPSQFASKADVDEIKGYLQQLASGTRQSAPEQPEVPDIYDDPAGYAAYLEERITQGVVGTMLQVSQAQQEESRAIEALGGEAARPFLKGLSAKDIAYLASDPERAAAFRNLGQMGQQKPGKQAPRSEGGFIADESNGLTRAQQREVDAAVRAWGDTDWFDAKEFAAGLREKARRN